MPPRATTLLLVALLSGCVSKPCCQKPTSDGQWPWKIPSRAAFLAKIPPPPAPGSAAAKRDLATVLALQSRSTPAKIAQAERSYDLTVFTYATALNPNFTPQHYPETAQFFRELNDLVNYENNYVKDAYKRPHPFQVNSRVQRIVVAKPGYSYPSYHSARCIVFQGVLAQLDPACKDAFDRISAQVEEDRVFAGEHFPSDIEGGKKLGRLIWAALEKDANFRSAIARLKKAEWTPPPAIAPH
jgi:acid phosphatase (class A)